MMARNLAIPFHPHFVGYIRRLTLATRFPKRALDCVCIHASLTFAAIPLAHFWALAFRKAFACLLADQPFRTWSIFCHRDVIASLTLHIFFTAFTTIADCFAIVVVLCLFVRVLQITGCFIALVRVSDGGESIWAVISCSHSVRVWSSLTNRWATCQSRSLICGHSNAIHCYFLYILRVAFAPAGACPNV